MGQEKIRHEETRQKFFKIAEGWMTPPTEDERMLLRKIEKLTFENIPIESKEQLVRAGMKPRECHINSHFLVDNDPTGNSGAVTLTLKSPIFIILEKIEVS